MPNRTKNPKAGDYVEILVPLGKDEQGNMTYEKGLVLRASMSDEKWADIKGRAEQSGRLSSMKDSEKSRPLTDATDISGDAIRFRDSSGADVVIPRGDMNEDAWYKRVVAASEKDTFQGATLDGKPIQRGPAKKPTETGATDLGDKPLEVVTPKIVGDIANEVPPKAATPAQPEAVPGATQSHRTVSGAGVTLTPDEPQASGPRKFFGDAMLGATPGPGSPAPVGGGPADPTSMPLMKGAETPAPMGMPAPGPGAPVPNAEMGLPDLGLMAPGKPDLTGIPAGTGRTPLDVAKSAGASLLGPSPGEQLGTLVDAGKQSFQQPQVPPGAPAPAPQPTSTSIDFKLRGGPSSAPGGAPSLDQAEKDFRAGQQKMVDTEAERARQQLEARSKYESDLKAFEAEQKAATIRQRENEDRINAAYLRTLEDVSKKAEIDPDHFWESKSGAQKAFMAIGGFLAGLGGRDPSGRIDQMIAQDIAVQRENFNLAREGAKNKLAGLQTVYGMLRQRGLDDREAASAARASMNQGMINKLEGIKEQMAPGEAQAKMDMAIAQFRMNKVKAEDDLKNSASERWARGESLRMQEFGIKLKQQAAGGKPGKEESPGTRSEVAKIDQALDAVDRLLADVSKVGPLQQVADANVQAIRGVLPQSMEKVFDQVFPGVSQREARAAEVGGTAKKAVAGEALSGEERIKAESNVPRPGLTQKNTAALEELKQQLISKRKSLESTRYSVGTAPAPDTTVEEQSGP